MSSLFRQKIIAEDRTSPPKKTGSGSTADSAVITSSSINSVVSNDIVELMEVKSEVLSTSFEANGSEEMIIEEFALDDLEGKEEFATDDPGKEENQSGDEDAVAEGAGGVVKLQPRVILFKLRVLE